MPVQEIRLELSPAVRALAARTDPAPFVESTVAAILAEVWGHHASNAALMGPLRASVTDNVTSILSLFAGRLRIEDISPPANFAFTDLAVQVGIPVSEIESAYWIGMIRFWRRWIVIAGEAEARGEGPMYEFVGAPTEALMQHLRHVTKMVVDHYEVLAETFRRTHSDRRRMLVTQVVEGESAFPLDDIERELNYRFAGTHLGLALQATERARVEQAVGNLAERVGAQSSLLTVHGADMWVCWLRFPGSVTRDCRLAVAKAIPDPHVLVTAGEPSPGVGGFRRTRSDALAAAALRRRFEGFDQFLWFRDVSLELCLLADEHAARRFVEDELGPLNAAGERAERARETLLAWLSCGSSSAVASRLFLHENTVRMRVSQAQELLPNELSGRRAEVLAALRLRVLLGKPA